MMVDIMTGAAYFITTLVFHELGHFIVAYRHRLKPQIIFTGTHLYTSFSDTPSFETKRRIYLFGVVLGCVPLFIGLFVTNYVVAFIPLYILGIVGDIKALRQLDDTREKD